MKFTPLLRASTVIAALLCSVAAWADQGPQQSAVTSAKRCPDGEYLGPKEGAQTFYEDPYLWFVSREFAQRFCMPERYIDDTLKGALALAVRLRPEDFTSCGFIGGPKQCPVKHRLLIDVYIDNRKVTLPKADPSVKYYVHPVANTAWLMHTGFERSIRRRKGEVVDEVGELRPFHPVSREASEGTVPILYLGARSGVATGAGIFGENFYRANWADGIDLITLDGYMFGYQYLRDPDQIIQIERRGKLRYSDEELDRVNPIVHWAIAFIDGPKYFNNYVNQRKPVPYPLGFDHVIVLPHKVAQIIYRYDWREGELLFNTARNALRPALAPFK